MSQVNSQIDGIFVQNCDINRFNLSKIKCSYFKFQFAASSNISGMRLSDLWESCEL